MASFRRQPTRTDRVTSSNLPPRARPCLELSPRPLRSPPVSSSVNQPWRILPSRRQPKRRATVRDASPWRRRALAPPPPPAPAPAPAAPPGPPSAEELKLREELEALKRENAKLKTPAGAVAGSSVASRAIRVGSRVIRVGSRGRRNMIEVSGRGCLIDTVGGQGVRRAGGASLADGLCDCTRPGALICRGLG